MRCSDFSFKALLFIFALLPVIISSNVNDGASVTEESYQRNVSTVINPKCPENKCINFTLVYVQQRGKSDTIHHIMTMEKVPTLFYARTELKDELEINWESMLSGNQHEAISFSKEPQYFAAVLITKFMMFNDLNDSGIMPDDCNETISFDTRDMIWSLKSFNNSSNVSNSVIFHLDSYKGMELDPITNVEIILTSYGSRSRSEVLPHLMYTENSTQVDFIFDHLEPKHSFNNARIAVELATIVSEPVSRFSINVSRSLDDEYTPGVFKLMEMRSEEDEHWMQWRPVCYTSTKRDIGDSTGLYQTQIRNLNDDSLLDNSLMGWLNLGRNVSSLSMQGFNVSFGVEGDGFYTASNYTAWTMVTGHGRPIGDQFSLMVILVMAIGLGLPAVVLLVGGMAIAIRNYRIGKDDLLLSN